MSGVVPTRLGGLLLLLLMVSQGTPFRGASALAQESAERGEDSSLQLQLPSSVESGREIWPIGVYQSQLIDVVPKGYRAVAVDELQDALIGGVSGRVEPGSARLVSSFYDIRLDENLLQSSLSEVVLETSKPGVVRSFLGTVNLAITAPSDQSRNDSDLLPQLEVDHQGRLIAVMEGVSKSVESQDEEEAFAQTIARSKLRFGWTLQGQASGSMRKFELQIPRTPQTRMVISSPPGMVLESRQGVLIESPGPPPDAETESRSTEIRWYVLEAGGLNRIELLARPERVVETDETILVRRELRQYEIDPSGLTWTHRVTVELPQQRETIRLACPVGTVASVRVNSVRVEHTSLADQDGTLIEVPIVPVGVDDNEAAGITLTVTGNSRWDLGSGLCRLPSVAFVDPNVIWAEPTTQRVVTVLGPLSVVRWELPEGWRQTNQSPARPDETVLIAEGPPEPDDPEQPVADVISLATDASVVFDDVLLTVDAMETPGRSIAAAARIRCRMIDNQRAPVPIEIQPGWTLDSITVVGSGRQVAIPQSTRGFTVWPTDDGDIVDSVVTIDVAAHRNLARGPGRLTVPSIWMVRPRFTVTGQVTALHPPKRRRWDGDSVMLSSRVSAESLDEEASAFLRPMSDTLLLRGAYDGSEPASLQAVDVSFDVSIKHRIGLENGYVAETVVISADSTSRVLSLRVLTDGSHSGLPSLPGTKSSFRWSFQSMDGGASIPIADANVEFQSADNTETHLIRLGDQDLNDYELVGERLFLSGEQTTSLRLASVSGAATATAEAILSPEWKLRDVPRGVQLVPEVRSAEDDAEPTGNVQRLRYDAVSRPTISIQRSRRDALRCLIWDQTLEVGASSRGEDVFRLTAEVSSESIIRIQFDSDLEITSVIQNGVRKPIVRSSKGSESGISISPELKTDRLVVIARRRHQNARWFRICSAPRIAIEGSTIRNAVVCNADRSTLLLGDIGSRSGQSDATRWGLSKPNSERWVLVHRDVGLGLLWLFSGVVFCIAWLVARRFRLGQAVLFFFVTLGVSASVIWWPAQAVVLVGIATPIAVAALLHAAGTTFEAQRKRETVAETPTATTATTGSRGESRADFSFTRAAPAVMFAALAVGGSTSSAQVADGENGATKLTPVKLLVPLSEDHELVGDKVYLADADYQAIKAAADPQRAVDARFQTADYRVILSTGREPAVPIEAIVEADYSIRLPRPATNVNLPVRAELLQRVQLLDADQSRILRFAVNRDGTVRVSLPPGEEFRLRLTFQPTITDLNAPPANPPANQEEGETPTGEDPLVQVRLPIPRVHTAKMAVESPRQIAVDSLGRSLGRTTRRSSIGRYSANVGPADEISLTCRRVNDVQPSSAFSFDRRYRISSGLRDTTVECEVTWNRRIAPGESVELTVVGAKPVSLSSTAWSQVLSDEDSEPGVDEDSLLVSPAEPEARGTSTYRFVKQSEAESPIRFIWVLPTVLNDPTSSTDSRVMPIPEVLGGPTLLPEETLFAFEIDQELRLSELENESQPIAAEEFLEGWSGYRGSIRTAFRAGSRFPSLALFRNRIPEATVQIRHELHVSDSRMELRFHAERVDLTPTTHRLLLRSPKGFRLVSCTVNGEPLLDGKGQPNENDMSQPNGRLVSLGDRRVNGEMVIDAIAEISRGPRGRIELPEFTIVDEAAGAQRYRITRDRSTDVTVSSSDGVLAATLEMSKSDLTEGRIPVLVWENESPNANDSKPVRVQYARRGRGTSFPCSQTSLMRYGSGRWSCLSKIEIPAARCPEFVDVQIPSRWISNLDVSGATSWVQRQSGDAEVAVVRVAPEKQGNALSMSGAPIQFEISGTLDTSDQVRVSVPDIVVLGGGSRKRVVAVPDRLTTEPIRWRKRAVVPQEPDEAWYRDYSVAIGAPESYSLFAINAANWSIDLEPISQASVDPVATASDARVIVDGDRLLVLQRYDLLPETQSEVEVKLPPDAECLGIWTAGREVDPVFLLDQLGEQEAAVRIPLAYSRLPQSLELLLELPIPRTGITRYLPELTEIQVDNSWAAFYVTEDAAIPKLKYARDEETGALADLSFDARRVPASQWTLSLAESVISALDRSNVTLAERSDEEIRQWMLPWVARFRALRSHARQELGTVAEREETSEVDSQAEQQSWIALDRRLTEMTEGFVGNDSVPSVLFSEARFDRHRFLGVARVTEAAVPMIEVGYRSTGVIRRIIIDALTLLMIGLTLLLLWPFRGRFRTLISHPSLWICVLACIAGLLLPLPLAITLISLAIGFPLLRQIGGRLSIRQAARS